MLDNDPRYATAPGPGDGVRPRARGVLRSALWVLLVLSAVANLVVSSVGGAPGVNLACGLVTAACVTGLAVLWRRERDDRPAQGRT
ncbi:hypothetical protein [Streptomyces iconiensis]|uniref:Uncharacterized protein n=1 Tax=Streptomyces iconiensis TaxID=1384038 RepID=A0ABT7A0D4_9ACTN|nr:hypothetical protein [Streptomyces iconiensis]MDJ1134797.1 hypothetical protein [Streptomyces iconiensis]